MLIHFPSGGGSGFGAAIALRFGAEGAKVIVADINVEGGEKVAAQNPNLIFQRMDVTQEADWQTIVDLAFSKYGGLDTLVNNAGTTYRNKVGTRIQSLHGDDPMLTKVVRVRVQPTTEVTEDEWERVFKVNVKSIFLASKVVMPRFIQQGKSRGGSMINISSTGASRPRPGLVWYNASKGAVTNVSDPARWEARSIESYS